MLQKISPSLAITFDVEEWTIPQECNVKSEYNQNTDFSRAGCLRILELFRKYSIKATFFVTGYFAEKEKDLVKLLCSEGHEVACHGYHHANLSGLKNDIIFSDISKATGLLSGLTGRRISGFRSPMCSIQEGILNILAEIGYEYDSSIHSAIVPGKYFNWQKPMKPYFLRTKNKSGEGKHILEIPISAMPFFRVPISWWWMRNLGSWVTYLGAQMNLSLNNNVVLYFHPWEYVDLPIIKGIPKHYTNRCGEDFLDRLGKFIKYFIRKYNFTVLSNLSVLYYKNSNFENSPNIL